MRRAFDVTATAQAAALASLDDAEEIARRRAAERRPAATGWPRSCAATASSRRARLSATSSSRTSADGRALFERLQREGVIVRPLDGFGAPEAIRVTVGTPEENEFFAVALGTRPFGRLVTSPHRWYFRADVS